MQRCIELARLGQGQGSVAPNPLVGSVIVHNGKIIGEGYHRKYGEAHAEVNAVASVKDKSLLQESTLYVNLEPCVHHGKTPPCADLVIEHKIPKVVIACRDPFPQVSGRGIEKLKRAGVEVTEGILKEEAEALNRRFFTFHQKKRPYIIFKWAQTLDGYIAPSDKKTTNISNELAHKLTHKWRAEEAAIMVGTNTALIDNPKLTVRKWQGKNPVRVILDAQLALPRDLHLFDRSVRTLVFTAIEAKSENNLEFIRVDYQGDVLKQVLDHLYEQNIQSLFVEGGSILLHAFKEQNLWDEARIFISEKAFGFGIQAPKVNGALISKEAIADNELIVFKNV